MAKRRKFSLEAETSVLTSSRRRCALCFGLEGDASEKEGQIAHLDRDPSNAATDNGLWLCTKHHSRYDSRSRQTKGHTIDEVRAYRTMLYEYLASGPPVLWPDVSTRPTRGIGVSLDVFDRRIPIYRATMEFLRAVVRGDKMQLEELFKFAKDTDEALFLFDDDLAEYLATLYRRANFLRSTHMMMEPTHGRTPELVQEWRDSMHWFTEQFEVARSRFVPYLRLSGGQAHRKSESPAGNK